MSDLKPILAILADGATLTASQADLAFARLMDGDANDTEIAAFLMALRVRGETIDEIAAGARALRERALKADLGDLDLDEVIDTCGTGGDAAGTYNISTAAALVAAGAGVKVAKHGNRAVSSKSGSAEVLAALGVNLEATPAAVAQCVREAGVGFLFAPAHHAAMRNVAGARQALGIRTIFNIVGPLSNPAGAKRQLLGVYDARLVRPMAEALAQLGTTKAWVVHGHDGLDEITTTAATTVAQLDNGVITQFEISPEDVGLARATPEALAGGDPDENAQAIRDLLDGAASAFRDIVVFNAGAALVVSGKASELRIGVKAAEDAIDDGRAKTALAGLVTHSHGPAA